MDPHQSAYLEEARELLSELETSLLELEDTPDDQELIGRVFRALHTIKGSGAMFGFDRVAEFTHQVETAFDMVRSGEIRAGSELINLTLQARDEIINMLDEAESGEAADSDSTNEIITNLARLTAGEQDPGTSPPKEVQARMIAPDLPESTGSLSTFRIIFTPQADILKSGTNPIFLLDELGDLGECTVIVSNDDIPTLKDLDPELCYVHWEILLTTNQGLDAIKDVFIFVEDLSEIKIELIEDDLESSEDSQQKKLGEILIERHEISADDLSECLKKQQRIGEVLVEKNLVSNKAIADALAQQDHFDKIRKARKKRTEASTIRVEAARLDGLINLVGELVTMQARLSQKAIQNNDPDLIAISEEADRLTTALRNNAMRIRMLPIGNTFSKFRRLVRDLSKSLEKEITLKTEGEDTELDKTVIDKLNDPLVHLIRNCIDHGIEQPEERERTGKPRRGTVRLKAFHSGAHVFLQITDDGRGLNPQAIRAKAIEKKLIHRDAEIDKKELFSMIFAAGFSTAETVSDVSGRGVGMDVVKKNIEALHGSIDIESHEGTGTTVTLKLPLTLAIIDGLLVEIDGGNFVIPLSIVEECLEISREEAEQGQERSLLSFRGEMLSYINLRHLFSAKGEPPPLEKVVVVEENGTRIGLGLDSVIGQHQTVIKSLSKVYQDVKGLSGATILGDGSMALILDIPQLVQCAESERQAE